ncbi:carbohydrate-binding family 9-like protein [Carboxylicivirga taeanensis]|uniref:carbohydrate-binding family 9-like protein n=1 Tax=Carboxylicivirga taeanensis TaxID=1416875 RepID=UPI003F6DF398
MKKLSIKPIRIASGQVLFPDAVNSIDCDNWDYKVDVKVNFGIAYDADNLYLKYKVYELHPKAVCTEINGPVWEDSCVEFFIAFKDEEYYNFEFNCIGTQLVGLGVNNKDRKWLDKSLVEKIQTKSSLGTEPIDITDTPTTWEMKIIIPKIIFGDDLSQFEAGQTLKANFYKCGDKQNEMHFLSWNPISHDTPNFHLPGFFGSLELVR